MRTPAISGLPGRLRQIGDGYPRQYWLLIVSGLINSTGGSMVWPFLTIIVRQRLGVPLTEVALLLTVNSLAGIVSMSFAGPAVDRFGRKWMMVLSLAVGGITMAAMMVADSMAAWAVLFAVNGAFGPLMRVGGDAMIADLVPEERRASAYALLRVAHNLGVAIGPSVGGFLAAISYLIAFGVAAGANVLVGLILAIFAIETLPLALGRSGLREANAQRPAEGGYGPVFRDLPFLAFGAIYSVGAMSASIMMVLLPVYVKEGFGVPEYQYGFIMATNAAMVVLLQYSTTKISSRFSPLPVLAVGAAFYGVGAGSVALGTTFPAFLVSMVILTIGEMLLVPTATTLTARLSPPDMRGRYMSVYSLTWAISFGIGPVVGGLLNDHVGPAAMWYGALAAGLAAAAGFVLLSRHPGVNRRIASPVPAAEAVLEAS